MTEAEFEEAFEHYYGESAGGIVQFGLNNEGGWVETYNAILALSKGQEAATAAGKDWRTEEPQEEDVKDAKEGSAEETEEPQAKLSPKPKEILGVGSKGSAVTRLQRALLLAGLALPLHGSDGHFGSETKDAVLAFKRKAYFDGRYEGNKDEFVNEETLALIESYGEISPQKKNTPDHYLM
jgi:pyruvate/2-oxoglutarate dehydrogenase complex dihydrolipoamide acyltransferase (E2) component